MKPQKAGAVQERLSEHDVQLNQIYDAMENLLDEKAAQRKWNDRERIGFKKWMKNKIYNKGPKTESLKVRKM